MLFNHLKLLFKARSGGLPAVRLHDYHYRPIILCHCNTLTGPSAHLEYRKMPHPASLLVSPRLVDLDLRTYAPSTTHTSRRRCMPTSGCRRCAKRRLDGIDLDTGSEPLDSPPPLPPTQVCTDSFWGNGSTNARARPSTPRASRSEAR